MSGGAFDYLYCKSVYDGLNRGTLERMYDALLKYGGSERAAALTMDLILSLDRLNNLFIKRLSPVFRAVEWDLSGSRMEDDVLEQLAKFNASEKTERVAEVSGWVCVRTPERDAWWMTKGEYQARFGAKP